MTSVAPAATTAGNNAKLGSLQWTQTSWLWVVSLFLVGFGAKLCLILHSGTPLPFWDAWYAEAEHLYAPYFEGHLTRVDFFRAHNEHRMVFPRLYCLALLLLNGQWDNQLQTVVNAAIHSATLAALGWALASSMGRKFWPVIWPPLALALVLPFAWENTLGGGLYTQFYFLLILSLLAIWFVATARPLSIHWWFGMTAAVAALFTAGSGFMAAAAIAGLSLLETFKQPRSWPKQIPTLVACAMICIAGLLLRVEVPHHRLLQAHSLGEFLISLGNNLAWPWIVVPPYAVFNLFPLLLLGWMYATSREESPPAEKVVLGIGIWVYLQLVATAYARGAGGSLPFWRYMDTSSFIMITDCLSMALLLTHYRHRLRPARPWLWYSAAAAWCLVCLAGLWLLTDRASRLDIPEREFYQRMWVRTTREFVVTDDMQAILNKPFPYIVRPDNPQAEADLIRNPHIRRILPACVRNPLAVTPRENTDHGFIQNGCMPQEKHMPVEPWWGSCSPEGVHSSFESLPVQKSALPFLDFPVAGYLGEPGQSLELVELKTGKITPVRASRIAGNRWLDAIVPAPIGEFKIVARSDGAGKWFAFKQPRELGRLSVWAIRTLAAWVPILIAGVLCLCLAIALQVVGQRSQH
jgi:hypothetical protein